MNRRDEYIRAQSHVHSMSLNGSPIFQHPDDVRGRALSEGFEWKETYELVRNSNKRAAPPSSTFDHSPLTQDASKRVLCFLIGRTEGIVGDENATPLLLSAEVSKATGQGIECYGMNDSLPKIDAV
jgi:hypothetical protein